MLLFKILDFAFDEIGLESVDLEVFPFNKRGIALYRKLRFTVIDNIVDEEADKLYRDIIIMRLVKRRLL